MTTHEYHRLSNGKTVQLFHRNSSYFACLIDITLEEPRIIEVHEFDTLFDASVMVSKMVRSQIGVDRRSKSMPFSPFLEVTVDNDNESLI